MEYSRRERNEVVIVVSNLERILRDHYLITAVPVLRPHWISANCTSIAKVCTRESFHPDVESRGWKLTRWRNRKAQVWRTPLFEDSATQSGVLALPDNIVRDQFAGTLVLVEDTAVRFFSDQGLVTESGPDIKAMAVIRTVVNWSVAEAF